MPDEAARDLRGTGAIPSTGRSWAGIEVMSWPSNRIVPGADGAQPGDRLHGGGLAGAVGPDQRDDLALLDVERDVADRLDAPVVDAEVLDLKKHLHQLPGRRR